MIHLGIQCLPLVSADQGPEVGGSCKLMSSRQHSETLLSKQAYGQVAFSLIQSGTAVLTDCRVSSPQMVSVSISCYSISIMPHSHFFQICGFAYFQHFVEMGYIYLLCLASLN